MTSGNTVGETREDANRASGKLDLSILIPVCLTLFMAGMWGQAFAPLIPQIASDLNASVALIGQVSTVSLVMIGAGSLFAGPIADRYGHRRCIINGLGISIIAAFLYAVAPTVLILFGAAMLGGLAFSMVHGVSFGVIVDSFTGDVRRQALSITQATVTSAGIIGAPIITSIASLIRWRGTFIVIALILAMALVLVARLVPEDNVEKRANTLSPRFILSGYRTLLGDKATRTLYLAAMLRAVAFGGPMIFLSAFLIDIHGYSLRDVGFALMATGAGIFLGNLVAGGRWLQRFDLRKVYMLATSVLGFGWFLVLTVQVPALAAVATVTLTFFIGGISYISRLTLLANISPALPATTMSLNTATLALGNAAGSAIAGLLLAIGGYELIGLAMPFISVIAGLLVWRPPGFLRPPVVAPQESA